MVIRLASSAYLFALGGCVATLAARDGSALWWFVGASVLAGLVIASGGS